MIRSTFYAFETAKQALSASQLGLDTVGHNIANINTKGYTRQRTDQVSISLNGYAAKYRAYGTYSPGQGSKVIGISQIRDPFLDRRYRTEAATCGKFNAISNGLADVNAIFDEITSTGSHAKMSEFLAALDKLIATADSKEHATVLRNQAAQIAQVLNKNSLDLDYAEQQIASELEAAVTDINSILEQIAMLNVKIKEDNFYGNPSNELNDTRNLLIDQLSELIDIDVKRTPIEIAPGELIEQLSIEVRGTGIMLVDSGTYNGVKMKQDDQTGEYSIALTDGISGYEALINHKDGTKSSDLSGYLLNGALRGHLNVLNGKGVFATANGENSFRGIPYYREALDEYANKFAETMNNMNALKVYDQNGNVVATIPRPLFVADDGSSVITAANFAVSDEWNKNGQYIEAAALNNAVYTGPGTGANAGNPGYLYILDDTGESVATDVHFSSIAGVDKDGYLLDTNGQPLVDGITGEKLSLKNIQRAITVESDADDPAVKLKYYVDDIGTADVFEVTINGTVYPTYSNIGTATTIGTAQAVDIDADGYLLDSSGNRIKMEDPTYSGPAPIPMLEINIKDLTKFHDNDKIYNPGDKTPNHLLPGAAANDNLLAMKLAIKGDQSYSNGFTGSFQEYLISFQSDMAQDKELNDANLDASFKVLSGIADSRDAVSGVSIDEEGINMMTFQNYYNAAARYMTVLDEALGTIIQGMGVVGR